MAAVAAVAVAAAVDALRGEGGEGGERVKPAEAEAASELRELGVEGTLVYADGGCGLRAVALPDLVPAPPPEGIDAACTVSVSGDGRHAAAGVARWKDDDSGYAVCRGARVHVVEAAGGRTRALHTGCAPGWRGEVLTVARDEGIVEAASGRLLVARGELRRAARRHPTRPDPPELGPVVVRDAAWLSADRVAVLLRATLRGRLGRIGPVQHVAFFERGRLLGSYTSFRPMERLDPSPAGDAVAVQPDTLVRADGTLLDLPGGVENVRRLTWSPDGRWLALVSRASVVLADTRSEGIVRFPLTALDLAWR